MPCHGLLEPCVHVQLEVAADASFIMVMVSVIWLVVVACGRGLPALNKCALPAPVQPA